MSSKLFISAMILLAGMDSIAQQPKKDGMISLRMSANDSMHIVTATVADLSTKAPLKGVEITFYVKRMFGILKIGNGTTDTMGITSAEFPLTMPPSDTLRGLIVLAKVEDNAIINDTSFQIMAVSKTSIPIHTPVRLGLGSSNAPIWLKITFWLIVAVVWGSFAYTLYLIYLIKLKSSRKVLINH
ncbi:hypothetical protein ACX0G9_07215 [Flavitalea flava]